MLRKELRIELACKKWAKEIWTTSVPQIFLDSKDIYDEVSLLNPVLYLVSGFRWSFYEICDVSIWTSIITIILILIICILIIYFTFEKGYKIKD